MRASETVILELHQVQLEGMAWPHTHCLVNFA
jgi:hypothetical protein